MSTRKKTFFVFLLGFLLLYGIGIVWLIHPLFSLKNALQKKTQDDQVETWIENRRNSLKTEKNENPFGEDGIARILLIGLDGRAGQQAKNCDAIQFIEINKNTQTMNITAIPRGTYVPLPPGHYLPGDYYVSNACRLIGIEYGIEQMEFILGEKTYYVIFIGFSQALGLLKTLQLPSTETLRWLRHRQGYAIGEPQRAHNHSTFLKYLLTKFTPLKTSSTQMIWQYPLYKMTQTDLSFAQTRTLVSTISDMELGDHPEKIQLWMKPSYAVTDIPYEAEKAEISVENLLAPIRDHLPEQAYSGKSETEMQEELLTMIQQNFTDPGFAEEGYQQELWLQIQDPIIQEAIHYILLLKHLSSLSSEKEKKDILTDYLFLMDSVKEPFWYWLGTRIVSSS